ncbi:Ubiquinone biosynthesis O-methyltransferase, mitochondrial [Sporomusa rhizae]|uniref:class I SAM-dependent methyltransferase n=1 Tax=Sporomusa rhizae TaxID=357999 RepID=UPI00352A4E56
MRQDILWNYYQNEKPESFSGSIARLRYIAKRIPKGSNVLNIGVGGGVFEKLALERGLEVYALDPDEATISNLRNRLFLAERAKVGYIENIPFTENSFDYVVVSEVLEHLSDNQLKEAIEDIHRVLVPGGFLIGTVPSREKLEELVSVCPECGHISHRWGHVQSFSSSNLSDLLSKLFTVSEITECYFVAWNSLNWKGKILDFCKVLLFKIGIHGSGETLFFLARKS